MLTIFQLACSHLLTAPDTKCISARLSVTEPRTLHGLVVNSERFNSPVDYSCINNNEQTSIGVGKELLVVLQDAAGK